MDITATPTLDPSGYPLGGNGSQADAFSRQLLSAMLSLRDGDFAIRLPSDLTGVNGKIADAFNDIATVSQRRGAGKGGVSRAGGKEGKLKKPEAGAGVGRGRGRR